MGQEERLELLEKELEELFLQKLQWQNIIGPTNISD